MWPLIRDAYGTLPSFCLLESAETSEEIPAFVAEYKIGRT